jgi:hypothetical protein
MRTRPYGSSARENGLQSGRIVKRCETIVQSEQHGYSSSSCASPELSGYEVVPEGGIQCSLSGVKHSFRSGVLIVAHQRSHWLRQVATRNRLGILFFSHETAVLPCGSRPNCIRRLFTSWRQASIRPANSLIRRESTGSGAARAQGSFCLAVVLGDMS